MITSCLSCHTASASAVAEIEAKEIQNRVQKRRKPVCTEDKRPDYRRRYRGDAPKKLMMKLEKTIAMVKATITDVDSTNMVENLVQTQ